MSVNPSVRSAPAGFIVFVGCTVRDTFLLCETQRCNMGVTWVLKASEEGSKKEGSGDGLLFKEALK